MKIGEYQVTAKLSKDSVYQWVEAVGEKQENQVILQLVQPETPQDVVNEIIAYFDKLQLIRRKGIWRPEQMFSDEQYPLIIVYPYMKTSPLKQILRPNSLDEAALEWLHQASEALHALHNKGLVHGYININHFVASEKLLYLTGFGYAPLLKLGYKKFLQSELDVLAPEVLTQQKVTKGSDIYAFAKTVAAIYPQIIDTSWYEKATNHDLDKRFKRMRNLFDRLKVIATKLLNSPPKEPKIQDIAKEPEEYQEQIPESNIVPKYQLSVKTEPPEAGKVIGGGNYVVDKAVTLTAFKSAGWNFAHWTGDVSGVENQVTVKMDANKTVVAHFTAEVTTKTEPKPEPKSPFKPKITTPVRLNLWVNAEPKGAGTIDGAGEYETGSSVKIRAWAANQLWQFDHWTGDLKGSENPAQLVMDANKKIQANFVKAEVKSNKLFPQQSNVFGIEPQTQQPTSKESEKALDPPPKRAPNIPKWAQPDK